MATYFSIDVECVAIGTEHNARAVAQIALVDEYERVALNAFVRPEQPVVSYLQPLTGLSRERLEAEGMPLQQALDALRSVLPRHAILVGQNIGADIAWLGLKEGEDFASLQDLAGLYRVWNPQYKSFSVFGQDHVAKTLLRWQTGPDVPHDAALDALKSVRLFNLHRGYQAGDPAHWAAAQQLLLETPPEPSFAKRHPTFEGVCMGNRRTCTCGAPFFY